MNSGTLISLGLYFLLMLGIGVYAFRRSTGDTAEYMLGGRRLSPAVAALSAGASDMSGWILLGLPGAAFLAGLPAAWIAIGLVIGAFANYQIVAARLRVYTEKTDDALTIPDFLEKRFQDGTHSLRLLASVVIILFFTLYTSATLVGGGKLFESAFGQPYVLGLWITAGIVMAYTFAGGFLAVSLTDFVQGCIMFLALIIVPIAAFTSLGDGGQIGTIISTVPSTVADQINGDPTGASLNLFKTSDGQSIASLSWIIGTVSLLAWGLGYFGQPHIIVRFMAIRSHKDVPTARNIGMSWMIVSLIGSVATGIVGLAYVATKGIPDAYLNNEGLLDPETIFIVLSQILFHPLVAGFLLAAILAAIMSTISSQLLVASSSLTEDIYRLFLRRGAGEKERVMVGRFAVILVAIVAVLIAYDPESSVLSLVANAWAGFGAAFGPVLILSLRWRRMTMPGALLGMLGGAVTVIVWTYTELIPPPLSSLYSIVPGFVVGLVLTVVGSFFSKPSAILLETHQAVEAELGAHHG